MKKSQLYKKMFPDMDPLISSTFWFDLETVQVCNRPTSMPAKIQTKVKIHKSGIWTGYGPNRKFFPDFSLIVTARCGYRSSFNVTVHGNSHKHRIHFANIDKVLNDAFEYLIEGSVFYDSLRVPLLNVLYGVIDENLAMRFIKRSAINNTLRYDLVNTQISSYVINQLMYYSNNSRGRI